jgi:hypothetical protein
MSAEQRDQHQPGEGEGDGRSDHSPERGPFQQQTVAGPPHRREDQEEEKIPSQRHSTPARHGFLPELQPVHRFPYLLPL